MPIVDAYAEQAGIELGRTIAGSCFARIGVVGAMRSLRASPLVRNRPGPTHGAGSWMPDRWARSPASSGLRLPGDADRRGPVPAMPSDLDLGRCRSAERCGIACWTLHRVDNLPMHLSMSQG
jgi:hypothetical protein